MRFSISMPRWSAAALGLALCACGGDGTMEPLTEPPPPAAIAMVSGDDQEGKAGEWLPEPFVVRVTDSLGNPVQGVEVTWRITSGEGDFGFSSGERLLTVSRYTNVDGSASALFRPTTLGTSTVVAEIAGRQGSSVTFSTAVAVVVIHLGPLFDCSDPPEAYSFSGPDYSSDVGVPVETPVEWVYAPWLTSGCEGRVASTSAPPGGEPFDSGILRPGERFRFVPDAAGTWEYEDQMSGATGTLTAR